MVIETGAEKKVVFLQVHVVRGYYIFAESHRLLYITYIIFNLYFFNISSSTFTTNTSVTLRAIRPVFLLVPFPPEFARFLSNRRSYLLLDSATPGNVLGS